MFSESLIQYVMDEIATSVASVSVELFCVALFFLGALVLRADTFKNRHKGKKPKEIDEALVRPFDDGLRRAIEAESAAGNPVGVLAAWRMGKDKAPLCVDMLKLVVQAYLDSEPKALVEGIIGHIRMHSSGLGGTRTAATVMDVVARAGQAGLLEELWTAFHLDLGVQPTCQVYEVLLGGYAAAGNEKKVEELAAQARAGKLKLTARGYSLMIKGFLKNGMVDAVRQQLLEMSNQGFSVPAFALLQFCRIASDAGRAPEALDLLLSRFHLNSDVVSLLLEDAARRGSFDFARRVEGVARDAKVSFTSGAFDALLKLHTVAGDAHAMELFQEMQAADLSISEGLCVGLLARCAEAKFLRFAEEIVKFVRSRSGMSIAVYSVLMKVYAYCGMYDKACDLYDQIRADGLEPDTMMYGCLMKFAVECGRTALSQQLSELAPSLDIQNYMSLIRAAGRDKDVGRAFAVLEQLKASKTALDIAAYNCVLDVCVTTGDMKAARGLVEEMKLASAVDIITFNTLLKGYCHVGDLRGAKELLAEMAEAGHPPNDVSYNCLINMAFSSGGGFHEAWNTIEMMEKRGVAVDHYTVSIMMKALKKVKGPKDVARVLSLLDRSGLDVCRDEILLNTTLETCIRHREFHRLEAILEHLRHMNPPPRPSTHTYGSLIKACSVLKRMDRCWEFWREMVEGRGLEPNDIVLGCMLDALVCNGEVDSAVQLLNEWKAVVAPNTVIYSTIIKGFANTRQAERALDVWREMRIAGLRMNTVVYNVVIDAHARVGAMEEVSMLVEAMEPDGCRPDGITYSTIVKGYCVRGDLDKAFEVFRNMQGNGLAKDAIIYNTLLEGCTRHGRMDLADDLISDMEKFEVAPSNFTLGVLVKMYGRRKKLSKAFDAVEKLSAKHGFKPNAQVLTCLMCACINNNALEQAFQVFNELKSSQGADGKAYGALISGCVRHGKLHAGAALLEESLKLVEQQGGQQRKVRQALQLEPEPVEQLLRALQAKGLMPELGAPLIERLRAAHTPVSGRFLSSVCDGNDQVVDQQDDRRRKVGQRNAKGW